MVVNKMYFYKLKPIAVINMVLFVKIIIFQTKKITNNVTIQTKDGSIRCVRILC